MEIQDFLDFHSEDQETKVNALKKCAELCSNPDFLVFLIENLESQENHSNEKLYLSLLMALKEFSRRNAEPFLNAMIEDETKTRIIHILFACNQKERPYIIDCFSQATKSCPDQFHDIFIELLGLINGETSSYDIYTILSLIENTSTTGISNEMHEIIGPIISAAGENIESDENSFLIIGSAAKILKNLISKNAFLMDELVDELISVFAEACSINSDLTNVLSMKESILNLFAQLIKSVYKSSNTADSEEQDINEEDQPPDDYLLHFNETNTPSIFQAAVGISSTPTNQNVINSLLNLILQFVSFGIGAEELITPDLFINFIIPAASLTASDINDYNVNPSVFIGTSLDDSNAELQSARVSAGAITGVVAKRFPHLVDPTDVICAEGWLEGGHIAVEARIYLLNAVYRAVKILDPTAFESVFDLLTLELPPFLVSQILMLVGLYDGTEDPTTACDVASHFIMNSTDRVVKYTATFALDKCLSALGENVEEMRGIIEPPISDLIEPLSDLSQELCDPLPAQALAKLFKFAGEELAGAAGSLIETFFQLWHNRFSEGGDSLECSQAIRSVQIAVDSAPEEQIIEIAPSVFAQLKECIELSPNGDSIDDLLTAGAYVILRIPTITEEVMDFVNFTLEGLRAERPIVCSFLPITYIIGVPIIRVECGAIADEGLLASIRELIERQFMRSTRAGCENQSAALMLAAAHLASGGSPFLHYVDLACMALTHTPVPEPAEAEVDEENDEENENEDEAAVTWAALFVIAAAFIAAPESTAEHVTRAAVDAAVARARRDRKVTPLPGFRELKMAFAAFDFLHRAGFGTFAEADDLAPMLFDMAGVEAEEERGRSSLRGAESFYDSEEILALAPLLRLPTDDFDEQAFHQEVAAVMPLD